MTFGTEVIGAMILNIHKRNQSKVKRGASKSGGRGIEYP